MITKKILAPIWCALTINIFAQTAISPASVPTNGTFYLMSAGEDSPPYPFDFYPGLAVYSIGNNQYVIDDRTVAAAKEILSQSQMMSTDDVSINPTSVNTDIISNDSSGGNFQLMDLSYETNGSLWIEVLSIDTNNNQISLRLQNTTNSYIFYQLDSKTNLVKPEWIPGQIFQGNPFTNYTLLNPVPMTSPAMFFRAQQAPMYLYIVAWQDAYASDAALGETNSQKGIFYIIHTDAPNDTPVQYSISGTARNGIDYSNISGVVTVPAGEGYGEVDIQPVEVNSVTNPIETVTLTLLQGPDYLIDPDAFSATLLIHNNVFGVVTDLPGEPVGIDYDPVLTNVIVSIKDGDSDFHHDDFIQLGTNDAGALTLTNWSGIQGLDDEVKVAIIKTNINGFIKGETYFGSNDGIGWLSADGTVSNLNWCILTNDVVTNTMPIRGSLYVDQTGVFSDDLVAVTSDSSYNLDNKGVWLINSNGQPRLLANILTKHLEGVITLPNDTDKYGPWAGKILTGDEAENTLYTIDTNGIVITNDTENLISGGIGSEDFDIIPTNQDLYCTDESHSQIVKISGALLTPYVGDLLITQSGDSPQGATPTLFIVRWDSSTTNFAIIGIPHNGGFEHVTFAPIGLPTSQ